MPSELRQYETGLTLAAYACRAGGGNRMVQKVGTRSYFIPNQWRVKMRFPAILKKYNKWLFSMGFATLKFHHSKDPSTYYTHLGDDLIETLNENFEDTSKPLWLN